MKKISFFLPNLKGGGAEKVTVNLLNQFVDKGYLVDLVLLNKVGDYFDNVDERVNIVDLNCKRMIYSLFYIIFYINKNRPDFLFSAMNYVNIVCIFCSFFCLNRIKVVAVVHNNISSRYKKFKGLNKLIPILMKLLYRYAYKIVCVSNGVKDDLISFLKISDSNIVTIYNSIDIEDINKKKKEIVNHHFIEGGTPIIVSVGRLITEKNHKMLINIFLRLRDVRKCKLLILGRGSEEEHLREIVSKSKYRDDIDFLGFQENPYKWMSICSIFALTSTTEGLPTVLIEALICDLKVISTNCPSGPNEILENGKLGYLVEMDERLEENYFHILNSMLDSSMEIDKSKLERIFSPQTVFEKYEELLK